MKKTAVEWFAEKIGHNSLMALTEYNEILEQAKEMEKEQSHAEYMQGWKDGLTKQETNESNT
jgi:hypothetical protein